jgi:SAM-dependent methyltransferase
MADLDRQTDYWNGDGAAKTFSHPVPLPELRAWLPSGASLLDIGCGYGRVLAELSGAGFSRAIGVDISQALVERGRREHPGLDLRHCPDLPLPFPDAGFDACLLIAVLTCTATDAGARALVDEALRLLKPGGLLFVSDYPLQADARNRERYARFEAEFGIYGVFRTGGAVCRHFATQRLDALLAGTTPLWRRCVAVPTMNGNPASIVQMAVRVGVSGASAAGAPLGNPARIG